MEVTIAFKGRVAVAKYKTVARAIINWQSDWAARTGDDHAPITLLSELVTWSKVCRFRADLSHSTHEIVNDLILRLVDLMEQAVITDVFFTSRPGAMISFEELFQLKGTPKEVAMIE